LNRVCKIRVNAALKRVVKLVVILLVGIITAVSVPLSVPVSAQAELTNTASYWDMGIRISYPTGWTQPLYVSGQMILSVTEEAMRGAYDQPIVALRLVDPEYEYGLPVDATLEQITGVALVTLGANALETGNTVIAGLNATYANMELPESSLSGQTIAFRLPDGRTGVIFALAENAAWAEFFPTFGLMTQSAVLLDPASFTPPTIGAQTATFPQGGLTFAIPDSWSEQEASNALLYTPDDAPTYADGSGYTNSGQLVVLAVPLNEDSGSTPKTPRAALAELTGAVDTDITDTSVAGISAPTTEFTDPLTGQTVIFVGIPAPDTSVMSVFRWTMPGVLSEVLRPTFDAILASVRVEAPSATLVPRATAPAFAAPNVDRYSGIVQTVDANSSLIIGDLNAPVRVVEFLDFSCPACAQYTETAHAFIEASVRSGDASYQLHYLTFVGGDYSVAAAYAAYCAAEQERGMEMHDQLYYAQVTQGAQSFTLPNLLTLGQNIGLDTAALQTCIESGKYANALETANQLADEFGIAGTPTLLIGRRGETPAPIPVDGGSTTIPTLDQLLSAVQTLKEN
jgi:protein-disulfide isomerase